MQSVEIIMPSGEKQQLNCETASDYNLVASNCTTNVCFFCDKTFTNVYNCRRHIRTHSGEKPFECKVCGKKFSRQSTLNAHEKVHTGNQLFKCDTCGHAFDIYRQLTEHQLVHRIDKPFTCKICNKSYSRATVLSQHMKSHTTSSSMVNGCGGIVESLPVQMPLNSTTQTVSVNTIPIVDEPITTTVTVPIISQPLYKCQQCEQMFVTPSELKDHEHVHISAAKEDKHKAAGLKEMVLVMKPDEPQVIQILPQISFVDAAECIESITPNNNFNCNNNNSNNNNNIINNNKNIIFKALSQNNNISNINNNNNNNSNIVNGVNNSISIISNTNATTINATTNNLNSINNNNNVVSKATNNCSNMLTVTNNIYNNRAAGNPNQTIVPITPLTITHPIKVVVIEPPMLQPIFSMDELNVEFTYEDPVTAQDDISIQLETKVCTLCNRKFRSDVDLQNHMKMHVSPNDRYKCEVCDRRFSFLSNFNAHKRIHDHEKPFRCTVCGKSFRLQKSLTTHMLLHTETAFNCPICDRTFGRNVNLKMHMKSHTLAERRQPKRAYIDVMCFDDAEDDLFGDDGNNTGAMLQFIEDISPTFCDICGEKFTQEQATIRTHKCFFGNDEEEMEEEDEQLSSPEVWTCE